VLSVGQKMPNIISAQHQADTRRAPSNRQNSLKDALGGTSMVWKSYCGPCFSTASTRSSRKGRRERSAVDAFDGEMSRPSRAGETLRVATGGQNPLHTTIGRMGRHDDRAWSVDAHRSWRAAEFERELIRTRTGEGREQGQGARAELRLQAEAHSSLEERGDSPPRPGRNAHRHAPSYNVHPSTISRLAT
jgi:hypothetical protein